MEISTISEKLKDEGWNLNASGIEQVTDNGKITDIKLIIKKLLDVDLRSVSAGTLPEDINKTKHESIPGGIVLQLQKVKNLSSPKYQETFNSNPDPSIIKVVLTDGVNSVQGVAVEHIPHLNLNTAPGSKIYLTGSVEIAHCFLLLNKDNTSVIGGRVELLIEKWELNRKLAKHKRDLQEEGGPPPWIPFGQKICKPIVTDRNFKSLEQGKVKEVENSEFEAQRKDAILEASKIGAPKVFGGGNNKLLDHNVQVIVDAGFTVEQAEYALKVCKNNKDRALRSLMSKTAKSSKEEEKKKEEKPERVREGGKGGKGRGRNREEEGSTLKPSAKVSLFDFLEDKLPGTEKDSQPEIRSSFEPKFSKPGRANDPQQQLLKSLGDERRGRDDGRFPARRNERDSHPTRHEDKRPQDRERKPDSSKYEGRRNYYDQQRADKSFGNFKVKNDFGNKTETVKIGARWNDKRDPKPGQPVRGYSREEKSYEDDANRNKSNFVLTGEKPPRFQRMTGQQNDMGQQWESKTTSAYPKLPSTEFRNSRQQPNEFPTQNNNCIPPSQSDAKLHNSLASLTLQQNIANFNHGQDARSVNTAGNKNLYFPSLGGGDSRVPPPATMPAAAAFQRRSPAPFIPQDIKTAYPGMPPVPDYPFKTNGTMMQGYNDFQAVFGGAVRSAGFNSQSVPFGNQQPNMAASANFSNSHFTHQAPPQQTAPFNNSGNFNTQPTPTGNASNYTAPFMSAAQLMHPPPPAQQQPPAPRRWSWKKGHKCYARYWEDQNYYEALVTGVSENTCVVHFIEYGNYEEVLHDDCVPIDGIAPET